LDHLVTTTAPAEDYVDTCLLRACEAIGSDTLSDGAGVAIPIEFAEPVPRTLRFAELFAPIPTPVIQFVPHPPAEPRMLAARVAVAFCAVIAFASLTAAFAQSPLAQSAPIGLAR
jgi:hypothetical protein